MKLEKSKEFVSQLLGVFVSGINKNGQMAALLFGHFNEDYSDGGVCVALPDHVAKGILASRTSFFKERLAGKEMFAGTKGYTLICEAWVSVGNAKDGLQCAPSKDPNRKEAIIFTFFDTKGNILAMNQYTMDRDANNVVRLSDDQPFQSISGGGVMTQEDLTPQNGESLH